MYNFENLKITLEFEKGFCLNEKNPFDAVLAYLYANELKKEGKYNPEKYIELPFVKQTNGVYHTSYPIFDEKKAFIDNYVFTKSFDIKLNQKLGKNKNYKPDLARGRHKMFLLNLERALVDKVYFYVCGDKTKIKSLLANLTHYGKKSSLDFGRIKRIKVATVEEDLSLFDKNGNPNRIIPVNVFDNVKSNNVVIKRAKYPYWERNNREICYC